MRFQKASVICLLHLLTLLCGVAQTAKGPVKLSAAEFNKKINLLESLSIIDVRTPEEYSGGHLSGSKNINWNDTAFSSQILKLDKTKPIFVYCLSGGRSGEAAARLRSLKFKEVYELDGGIMKWRAAGLSEKREVAIAHDGMSRKEFDQLIKQDSVVLIDFYAIWCSHCKKLAPELDDLSQQMDGKLKIIKIDFDKNQALAKELKVDGLPKLLLYKNNIQTWDHTGYVSQDEIKEQLKSSPNKSNALKE